MVLKKRIKTMQISNLQISKRNPGKLNCSAVLKLSDKELIATQAEDENFYFTCEVFTSQIRDCLDVYIGFPGSYETNFSNTFDDC